MESIIIKRFVLITFLFVSLIFLLTACKSNESNIATSQNSSSNSQQIAVSSDPTDSSASSVSSANQKEVDIVTAFEYSGLKKRDDDPDFKYGISLRIPKIDADQNVANSVNNQIITKYKPSDSKIEELEKDKNKVAIVEYTYYNDKSNHILSLLIHTEDGAYASESGETYSAFNYDVGNDAILITKQYLLIYHIDKQKIFDKIDSLISSGNADVDSNWYNDIKKDINKLNVFTNDKGKFCFIYEDSIFGGDVTQELD